MLVRTESPELLGSEILHNGAKSQPTKLSETSPLHHTGTGVQHMKTFTVLALSIILASGAAIAHETGSVSAAPATSAQSGVSTAPTMSAQSGVSTAPTPRAPSGVTIDQGAGVPGRSAFEAAPHPTTPHPHGPDNPQAGTPGTQDPSQLGR